METTDLGASKPSPAPPQPKQSPLVHGTVKACGHKLDLRQFPTQANCFFCWEALFEENPQAIASIHNVLTQQGTPALERMQGKKFVKFFGKFLQKKLLAMHTEGVKEPEPVPTQGLEVPGLEEVDGVRKT